MRMDSFLRMLSNTSAEAVAEINNSINVELPIKWINKRSMYVPEKYEF